MRKYSFLLLLLLLLTACSDYLDVKPQSQIDKDILFQTEEGFMEALNGLYLRATAKELYGDELTFGLLDVLAQNYSVQDVSGAQYNYQKDARFIYDDKNFIARKDALWGGLYNVIGNCNLLLENLDKQENVLNDERYQLIKGEALTMRAYMHLDALRIFAPSYKSNPAAPAIPYVTDFSNGVFPQLTVEAALDSVINDLESAKRYLENVDPILNANYKVGYTTDEDDADDLPDDDSNEERGELFLQNRRHRLNYFATCGLLARAYLCRGNEAEALYNAKEVINSDKFPWTLLEDFTNVESEKKDRILYPELIFAWSISTRVEDLRDRFEKASGSLFVTQGPGNSIYETVDVGGEDIRYKQWFKLSTESSVKMMGLVKYHREETNKHPLMAPAIRLSEMYYIASECSYDSDQHAAWDYFNKVRLNRGIGGSYEIWSGSKEALLSELLKDARKEFYGEGQIFYMYKRLNKNMKALDGSVIAATDEIFELPLPDSEIEFGRRD
jgi:hypothetical protein